MPKYTITVAGKAYDIESKHDLTESEVRSYVDQIRSLQNLRKFATLGLAPQPVQKHTMNGVPISDADVSHGFGTPSISDAVKGLGVLASNTTDYIRGEGFREPDLDHPFAPRQRRAPMEMPTPRDPRVVEPQEKPHANWYDQAGGLMLQAVRGVGDTAAGLMNPVEWVNFPVQTVAHPGQMVAGAASSAYKAAGALPSIGHAINKNIPELPTFKTPRVGIPGTDYLDIPSTEFAPPKDVYEGTTSILNTALLAKAAQHGISKLAETPVGQAAIDPFRSTANRAERAIGQTIESGIRPPERSQFNDVQPSPDVINSRVPFAQQEAQPDLITGKRQPKEKGLPNVPKGKDPASLTADEYVAANWFDQTKQDLAEIHQLINDGGLDKKTTRQLAFVQGKLAESLRNGVPHPQVVDLLRAKHEQLVGMGKVNPQAEPIRIPETPQPVPEKGFTVPDQVRDTSGQSVPVAETAVPTTGQPSAPENQFNNFVESNRQRIAEIEQIRAQRAESGEVQLHGGMGSRQRGAVSIGADDIELLARKALDTAYRTGKHVVDALYELTSSMGLGKDAFDAALAHAQSLNHGLPSAAFTKSDQSHSMWAAMPANIKADNLKGAPSSQPSTMPLPPPTPPVQVETPLDNQPNLFDRTKQIISNALEPGRRLHSQLSQTFNPESMSDNSGRTARVLREGMGTAQMMQQSVLKALKVGSRSLDALPSAERMAFADRYEKGEMQPTPELQRAADALREVNARNVSELQAEGVLPNAIENYLPHLFKDPAKAKKAIGEFMEKTLKPNKDFLKHRNYDLLADALKAAQAKGLELVTDNPVEAMRLRSNSIASFVAMRKAMRQLLPSKGGEDVGIRYVRVGADVPNGYVPLSDRAWSVFGPGEVTVRESYDGPMREALLRVADNLGINHERVMSIRGAPDALGVSLKGKNQIQTTWGSPETILTHEIGHAIDDQFNMRERLFAGDMGKTIRDELGKLADMRYEGASPDQSYKDYVRTSAEMVANLFHAYVHAPEMAAKIAPTAVARLERIIDRNPKLQPLRDVTPSLRVDTETHQVRMPGLQVMGKYYAPPDVAAVLNNWAEPGWGGKAPFEAAMSVNRNYNQVNLAGASVHGIGSLIRAQAMDLGLALQEMFGKGMSPADRLGGAGRAVMSAVPVAPAARYAFDANRVIRDYLAGVSNPETAAVIEGLRMANGRITPDSVYIKKASESFSNAIRAHDWGIAAKTSIPAFLEGLSYPVMQYLVPKLKVGAFMNQLLTEMKRTGAVPGTDQFAQIATKSWDHVDDILGQVVWDNIFAKKWVKDAAQLSARSASWSGGSIRTFISGAKEMRHIPSEGMNYHTGFLIALPIVSAIYGGLLHRMATGKNPETLTDYYYPKTGRKNPDGTDERLSLPTELKEAVSYYHDPTGTLMHKESPLFSLASDLNANQSFGGTEIANPDDPLLLRTLDKGKYLAKSMLPFSVSTMQRQQEQGKGFDIRPMLGLNPAPSYITRSEAMNLAADYSAKNRPIGTRTQQEADRSMARSALMGMIRNGDTSKVNEFIKEKGLTEHDIEYVAEGLSTPRLLQMVKSLKPDQAIHVYQVATPEEKQILYEAIVRKIQNQVERYPQDAPALSEAFAAANR